MTRKIWRHTPVASAAACFRGSSLWFPPPSWGRDRVGGDCRTLAVGIPPPLAPPHKGEGNRSHKWERVTHSAAAARIARNLAAAQERTPVEVEVVAVRLVEVGAQHDAEIAAGAV